MPNQQNRNTGDSDVLLVTNLKSPV